MKNSESTENVQRSWCLFRIGEKRYAVALDSVGEVIEAPTLTSVPFGPPFLTGLCAYRRDVIPVFSMGDPNSSEAPAANHETSLMILHTRQGPFGVRVENEGTVILPDQRAVAPTLSDSSHDSHLDLEGVSYELLDVEERMRQVRGQVESWYHEQNTHLSEERLGAEGPV